MTFDGWLYAAVDAISWFVWNPALGAVCGVIFGRAVVRVLLELPW